MNVCRILVHRHLGCETDALRAPSLQPVCFNLRAFPVGCLRLHVCVVLFCSYAREGANVTLRGVTLSDNKVARGSVVFLVDSSLQTYQVQRYRTKIAPCARNVVHYFSCSVAFIHFSLCFGTKSLRCM